MKKTILALALVGLIANPFAVSAVSVEELQVQIKSLLARVAELQMQLKLQASSTTPSKTTMAVDTRATPRICGLLQRSLSQGAQGDDVAGLQEFLKSEGHLSANATGYYGPLTAQAVAKWQAAEGVSAVGSIGPISRERLKIKCGSLINKERFSATPQRGEAPLTVVFDTWLSGFRVNTISYTIDFGDGASERAADCYAPADACQSPGQNKHTYTSNGTYTATLNKITDPCAGQVACRAAIHSEVVGKLQIMVGTQACTKEYMPVCGSKPIVCITTPCNPIQQTYGNRCMMNADGATFVNEGQCRADTTNPADDKRCKAWYDGCNSCGRTEPGGPAMCTLKYCTPESMTKPSCTAYFDNTTNKAPVVSGFSGPTTLTLNEQGTWKIQASDPENGSLSYSVTWGDEWYANDALMRSSAAASVVQSTTFTHSYAQAGNYTVTIIVKDAAGNEAKTSTTVQVGNTLVACTEEYAPVCGRPSGCANTCPPGMFCTMVCRLHNPVTYSNKCKMQAADASLLHIGACTATSGSIY